MRFLTIAHPRTEAMLVRRNEQSTVKDLVGWKAVEELAWPVEGGFATAMTTGAV